MANYQPDTAAYYRDALRLNPAEEVAQSRILSQLPSTIVDSHVHTGLASHIDYDAMPVRVRDHMATTFPHSSIELSGQLDDLLMPGIRTRKVRFAHAFRGVQHRATNAYLANGCPDGDSTALFGLSDSPADVAYTVAQLENNSYNGLKMYYLASDPPKSQLFDYFPPPILAAAEQTQTPIILHLPNRVEHSLAELNTLAETFPDLPVILAHVGVTFMDHPAHARVMHAVSRHKNIFVDTSGVYDAQVIATAIKKLGVDHVLYGSDEPLNLLRDQYYVNPQLGTRLITDYPYHWVDLAERAQWLHTVSAQFIHGHWRQLQAILDAIPLAGISVADSEQAKQAIFFANAAKLFAMNTAISEQSGEHS